MHTELLIRFGKTIRRLRTQQNISPNVSQLFAEVENETI